jgi:multiple sugar transport system substrate-binding protein
MSEPKKVDRRKFIYAGLGAVAVIAIGAAAYVAMNPPVLTQTVTTTVVTTTVPTTTTPGKRKLTVWGRASFAPAQMYWASDLLREWAEKKGIDIEITWIPVADQAPKLAAAIAAGNPPDVLIGGDVNATYGERGLLVPLDDIVNELGKDDIFEGKLDQGTFNGHICAISTGFEMTWLHVRKDLAEKAGVLDLFPFRNENDILEAAEKLSKIEPGVYGIGIPLGSSGFDCSWTFQIYFEAFGGGWATGKTSKDVVIGKEPYRSAAKKAFGFFRTIWENGWTPPDSDQWVDVSNNLAYLDGRIAMTSNPMSIWYAIMTGKQELAPKTMLVPDWYPLDLGGESAYAFKGKNEDLAKELILYFFKDKERYRKGWCEQSFWYNLPIFKSQMEEISKAWQKGSYKYWGIDPMEAVKRLPHGPDCWIPYNKPIGVLASWNQAFGINEMVVRAVIKKEDPDKVLDDVQKKLEEEFRKEYGA